MHRCPGTWRRCSRSSPPARSTRRTTSSRSNGTASGRWSLATSGVCGSGIAGARICSRAFPSSGRSRSSSPRACCSTPRWWSATRAAGLATSCSRGDWARSPGRPPGARSSSPSISSMRVTARCSDGLSRSGARDLCGRCSAPAACSRPSTWSTTARPSSRRSWNTTLKAPYLRQHVAQNIAGRESPSSPMDGPVDVRAGLRWLRAELCAIVEHGGEPGVLGDDARFRAFRMDASPAECRIEDAMHMPTAAPRLASERPRLVVLRSLFAEDVAGGAR
jgi:hypothetical protein